MKRILLPSLFSLAILIFSFNSPAFSFTFSGEGNDELLVSIEQKLNLISARYEQFEMEDLKSDITSCYELISTLSTSNPNTDSLYQMNYDLLLNRYSKIEYADYLLSSLEAEKERMSMQYFQKWDKVFQKKKRVDMLYTKKQTVSSVAHSVESDVISYRKKNIYSAYNNLYDYYMIQLKRVNECDNLGKVTILAKAETLLESAEKLLFDDNTKELEKNLRKVNSPEAIASIMKGHELSKKVSL